jgi:uncharacterized membrane protein YeaQ/YmgE (transglycosylase-associated protein family)
MIATIFIGLIVGAVAKLLMPGKDPGGWIVTILLGIAGSFVDTWLSTTLGLGTGPVGFIGSVIGAMILLLIYRMVIKKKEA